MTKVDEEFHLNPARFGRRLLAFLIDIIPITMLVGALFALFGDFDQTLKEYLSHPHDMQQRAQFLLDRNHIRDLALACWLMYSTVMDALPIQGTLGKRWLKIRVVDRMGRRLSLWRATMRNICKIVSALPFSLGFLWALFSKNHRTWHDQITGTCVIDHRYDDADSVPGSFNIHK